MTTLPKTMAEICQEGIKEQEQKLPMYVVCDYSFKAGFDCRDKLDNEVIDLCEVVFERLISGFDQDIATTPRSYAAEDCRKALAEIRKITGGEG